MADFFWFPNQLQGNMLQSYSQGNVSWGNRAGGNFSRVKSRAFFEKKRLEITRLSAWADTMAARLEAPPSCEGFTEA
jgi:hypothetical protein